MLQALPRNGGPSSSEAVRSPGLGDARYDAQRSVEHREANGAAATGSRSRRDRAASELDRQVAERTQADTEFLARELASVRLALADVATGEEFRDLLAAITDAVNRIEQRLDRLEGSRLDG